MSRLPRILTAFVALVVLTAGVAVPASAEGPPAQAEALCIGAPRGCDLSTGEVIREGTTFPVTITGNAHVRLQVVIYLAEADGADLVGLRPISDPVEAFTDANGRARVQVSVPALDAGPSAGWALLSVGGVSGTDVSTTVGRFVPFGARVPTILGDGNAVSAKPVGTPLELRFTGAVPGTRFAIDYQDDHQVWHEITSGEQQIADRPEEISVAGYTVPRGLSPTPKKFRLRNVSDSAVSSLWLGTPAVDGVPAELTERLVPPPVGTALAGTSPQNAHPSGVVRLIGAGIAVACLVGAVAAVTRRAVRGRSVPWYA